MRWSAGALREVLRSELAKREENPRTLQTLGAAAGALESQHIASVLDFGHASNGIPYIVIELLVGEDLARSLARKGRCRWFVR